MGHREVEEIGKMLPQKDQELPAAPGHRGLTPPLPLSPEPLHSLSTEGCWTVMLLAAHLFGLCSAAQDFILGIKCK